MASRWLKGATAALAAMVIAGCERYPKPPTGPENHNPTIEAAPGTYDAPTGIYTVRIEANDIDGDQVALEGEINGSPYGTSGNPAVIFEDLSIPQTTQEQYVTLNFEADDGNGGEAFLERVDTIPALQDEAPKVTSLNVIPAQAVGETTILQLAGDDLGVGNQNLSAAVIDWNDGTVDTIQVSGSTANLNAFHTYQTNGQQTATAKFLDDLGQASADSSASFNILYDLMNVDVASVHFFDQTPNDSAALEIVGLQSGRVHTFNAANGRIQGTALNEPFSIRMIDNHNYPEFSRFKSGNRSCFEYVGAVGQQLSARANLADTLEVLERDGVDMGFYKQIAANFPGDVSVNPRLPNGWVNCGVTYNDGADEFIMAFYDNESTSGNFPLGGDFDASAIANFNQFITEFGALRAGYEPLVGFDLFSHLNVVMMDTSNVWTYLNPVEQTSTVAAVPAANMQIFVQNNQPGEGKVLSQDPTGVHVLDRSRMTIPGSNFPQFWEELNISQFGEGNGLCFYKGGPGAPPGCDISAADGQYTSMFDMNERLYALDWAFGAVAALNGTNISIPNPK